MPVITGFRARRAAAFTSVAALALVGCGEQVAQSPGQQVQDAASGVFDAPQLTVSVGLDLDDVSRAAVQEMLAQEQASDPATPQLGPAAVERLLQARIVTTMATTDGTDLSEADISGADLTSGAAATNVSSSVSLVVDGDPLVELRQVAGVLYARADAAGLETALETPGLVDGLGSLTAGAPPELTDAASALASGGWVSLDATELAAQLEQMGGQPAPAPSDDASAVAGAVQRFLDDAGAVLTREVEVTENGPDAYEVTAPLDRILSGLTPALKTVVTELAASTGAPTEGLAELDGGLAEAQEELAGRSVSVDVTTDDDRLSTITMDLAQLLDEQDRAEMTSSGVTGLPLVVELSQEGEVEAPQDAVELDLAGIMSQAMAGMAAAGGDA